MKVILYMAISTDGFIAKKDGDSDWVSEVDSAIFEQKIKEAGCVVVGRRTFDQYQGDIYPMADVTNIVLTTDAAKKSEQENIIFARSPKEALNIAEKKGHNVVLLAGGGITNGLFLNENLVDEVFLSVHPLILGEGVKLFENCEVDINLELVGVQQLEEGLVQLHFKIKKGL